MTWPKPMRALSQFCTLPLSQYFTKMPLYWPFVTPSPRSISHTLPHCLWPQCLAIKSRTHPDTIGSSSLATNSSHLVHHLASTWPYTIHVLFCALLVPKHFTQHPWPFRTLSLPTKSWSSSSFIIVDSSHLHTIRPRNHVRAQVLLNFDPS